jgi:exopolyphosphatase/guanosine-5'-triphosphate,3'-diphosphate pyrophosphatase
MSPDTILIGVGGTLRAMARYDQQLRKYGLDKIHNYQLRYSAASYISERFYNMNIDELSEIKAIGNNRVDTITAGSAAISTLMEKFNFDRVIVSAQGLREGIVSAFIRDLNAFENGTINNDEAKNLVTFACHEEMLPQSTAALIEPLVAAGILRQKEKIILTHAIKQLADLPTVTNLNNLFYMIMDEDNAFLTHREQLILALSIIHTKKEKVADWLFSRYKSTILESQNKKSIEKIASCLMLSTIIEKSKANISIYMKDSRKIDMRITRSSSSSSLFTRQQQQEQFIPLILLENAMKKFQDAFGVSVFWSIEQSKQKSSVTEERMTPP